MVDNINTVETAIVMNNNNHYYFIKERNNNLYIFIINIYLLLFIKTIVYITYLANN